MTRNEQVRPFGKRLSLSSVVVSCRSAVGARLRGVCLLPVVGLVAVMGVLAAAECRAGSDAHSLSAIFAEQHVDGTALEVHQHALALAPEERFEWLTEWVLPNQQHPTLRLQYGFTPTHPAPPVTPVAGKTDDAGATAPNQSGGELISPVYDLIDVAVELGRLEELRSRIESWDVPPGSRSAAERHAMLVLLALAEEDTARATTALDAMLAICVPALEPGKPPTGAEVLVFDRGLRVDALREAVASGLYLYQPWVRSRPYDILLKRHVFALLGELQGHQLASLGEQGAPLSEQPLRLWHPVSRMSAATRGAGVPPVRWDRSGLQVRKAIGHGDDNLYFGIPLRGNYQVECDISDFGWREAAVMVAGTWVAPVYTLKHYDHGNLREERPRRALSAQLTRPRHWIHFRTVVQDGMATTYFNGRFVHSEPVRPDASPWLAIRSRAHNESAARNIRITGQPEIPRTLRLSADSELSGWVPYFDEVVGDARNDWLHTTALSPEGEIIGRWTARKYENLASDPDRIVGVKESLLQYHRPMLEDGTIEYEFQYRPGVDQVHPAIDRMAFLLAPEGVRIHWITDGPYDRTGLSPSNVYDEPENRRGDGPLPLKVGEWNRLRLQLTGDVVTLELNGSPIYERQLDANNQRTFGLFHYSDLSQVRVRNVEWTGEWPRELPSLSEQELGADEAESVLADREHLVEEFRHDFVAEGLSPSRFMVMAGMPTVDVRSGPEGVTAMRHGTGGYRNATISPRVTAHGDFDVIATYDRFESSPPENGMCLAALFTILDNPTRDEYFISRRDIRRPGGGREQLLHCVIVRRHPDGDQRSHFVSVPMEERSGRMWLARRGDRMYYLTAEGDSPNFRLRGEKPVEGDPTAFQGIRLLSQIYRKDGLVSVVWKSLEIRAEKLEGPAVEPFEKQLAGLDRERDQFSGHLEYDFNTLDPHGGRIYQWNNTSPWKPDEGGWTIINQGTDQWSSTGASVHAAVQGDFDVRMDFDSVEFAEPKPNGRSSVYLQIEFPDEDRTQYSHLFSLNSDGRKEVVCQVRLRKGDGEYDYVPIGGFDLARATSLRIARRGNRGFFLVTSPDFDHELLAGEAEFPMLPIHPRNIRIMVHTSGDGRQSRVRLKSFDVRGDVVGEAVLGADPAMAVPTPPRQQKGLLDSIRDLFR